MARRRRSRGLSGAPIDHSDGALKSFGHAEGSAFDAKESASRGKCVLAQRQLHEALVEFGMAKADLKWSGRWKTRTFASFGRNLNAQKKDVQKDIKDAALALRQHCFKKSKRGR